MTVHSVLLTLVVENTGPWQHLMLLLSLLYAQNSHTLDMQQQSRTEDRHDVILYECRL